MADELEPGSRRTSAVFDEIETRALRGWSKQWDGGFNDIERVNFVADHKRVVKHVDQAEADSRAAAVAVVDTRNTKRFRTATRWTAIAVLIAGFQTGLILITRSSPQPQTIVVKLPGGQNVTITPQPTVRPTPLGGTEQP